MSSDFEQQQKSPATQQAEEGSSMKIKPDSELPVLTTHSSTSVEKPLSIDINATESVEGPSSNEKLITTPNASSLHSNQSTHESQTSRNSDSVCGCCGLETAQIRPMDMDISSSTSLSQEAAKMRRQETAAQYLMQPSEEEPHEWIYCNACQKWFHSLCVGLEQYEVHLIDKFHCPTCLLLPHNGPSTMKVKRLLHRYAFDKEEECDQPEQIGTEAWTNDFLKKYCEYPEAVEHSMAKTYGNGTELMKNFNMHQDWTEPIKVLNKTGLGLKMPKDPSFDIKNVVDLLGRHINVQTIDVFAQQTYSMSLGRFHDIWNQPKRDRLYNILSLEFTDTKLDEIVRSPTLAKELSWVENFWPNSGNQGEGEHPNEPTDVYEFSDKPMAAAEQQESARPYVEHYCLMGMQGSYTDFHIDFGGSSVWYHVFKGEKVFFIVRPTSENLAAFLRWQKDEKRSEQFFGHFLPPGEKLYRLHVHEGETLFLPAGWIHSVFTPKDSLVFGGNFLHTLNVPMQMKVFDMELEAGIEERFKFPYFELCNFYATKYLGEQLKDYRLEGKLAKQVFLDAASELYEKCSKWLEREKNKFSIFNGNVNSLNRELKSQLNLQKILSYESKQKRIDNPLSSSSPINMDNNSNGVHVHLRKLDRPRMVKGQIQDMDSSWEEGEDYEMMEQEYNVEDEEGECSSDTEGVDDELQPLTSQAPLLNRKRKNHPPDQLRKFVVKQQNIHSATGTADDNNEQQSSSATTFVENGTEGQVRLKIRLPPAQLPCWRQRQATTTQQSERIGSSPIGKRMNGKKTSASVKMDEEEEPNLAAMFTTPSTHGRRRRTTARVLGGIPNSQENRQNSAGDALTHPRDHSDKDVLTPVSQRASKNFMDQYTPEERYQIELSDKAGEMDARGELFSQSAMKKPPTKRATKKKEKKPKDVTSGSGQATESTTPKNPADKKQPIKKRGTEPKKMTSRERVAKKIGFRLK